ncbi:hypothetical protein Mgra_00001756 [Meloidogyne graminicola]|uniref:Peptidase M13 C-terminal domain-containing protein n=1 Tax=Meloidogyne graminicola TaxID=189291 RepID=A0A8S9ZY43_9BILA|nr:hypothetical protein Mgra_00001756 [Meloidogyne graminicola]
MSWTEMFIKVNKLFYLWPTIDYQASFVVDGYYKWVFNSLAIYGGIMYSPWFNSSFPNSLNFGGIGTLIGHEISHGFDSNGFYFDENGNKINNIDNKIIEKMEEKYKCFIEQYNDYENEKLRPNPRFTLSENIADNTGIRASYKNNNNNNKIKINIKKTKEIFSILDQFTEEQKFFIGNAFTYCSSMNEKDKNNYAINDVHAFPKTRVNLPLRNFEQFAKAFNCPLGTKINGKGNQCRLW